MSLAPTFDVFLGKPISHDHQDITNSKYLPLSGTDQLYGNIIPSISGVVIGSEATPLSAIHTHGIYFEVNGQPEYQEGCVFYDASDKTLSIYPDISGVSLQIGQENWIRVDNRSGVDISNGDVVYINGAHGNRPTIEKIDCGSLVECAEKTIGIATHDIDNDKIGYVTSFGLVRDVDTEGITAGDELWLSTEAGKFINVRPTFPNKAIKIGYCLYENKNHGIIFVNIQTAANHDEVVDAVIELSGTFDSNGDITHEFTGFEYPEQVDVIYDELARTITISGNIDLYYHGKLVPETSGTTWTSDPHDESPTAPLFLKYNANQFEWSTDPWNFYEAQIAYVCYKSTGAFCFAQKEIHGFMPWQTHEVLHKKIGTFRDSGGDLSGFVLNSTTANNRRPLVTQCRIFDEDNPATLQALAVRNQYTRFWLTSTNTANFLTDQTEIVSLNGGIPQWNQFVGNSWQLTTMTNNQRMSVWVIALEATSDAKSKKHRFLFMPGQSVGNLASQQALSPLDLNVGELLTLSPEFVFIAQIIISYVGGNWQIEQTRSLTGSRALTISQAGAFLTSVNASQVAVDTSDFENIPTSADTVQKSLAYLDNYKFVGSFDDLGGSNITWDSDELVVNHGLNDHYIMYRFFDVSGNTYLPGQVDPFASNVSARFDFDGLDKPTSADTYHLIIQK